MIDAGRPARREVENTWCPGCGNFGILVALEQALAELRFEPRRVCVVSGIGQAGKLPHYLRCNFLHGLHGRALPAAIGVRLVNPRLKVIAIGGDGDMYGEGGGPLLHAFRRNAGIACFVHNNGVYGLTKGQASPTSGSGAVTRATPQGSGMPAFNPVAAGLAMHGTFVARAFAGDIGHLTAMMVAALQHRGFGFIDVLQPCVTFNKVNAHQWYKQRVYDLAGDGHDPTDLTAAFGRAREWPDSGSERIPVGLFYTHQRPTYEEQVPSWQRVPAIDVQPDPARLRRALEELR
ncbi:2-oxoacid ferredoxin oxidoreductase [candidate division WOR-3 bacterium]|nr:2-oxoacid ferredoxin oxidoreductase [candidate division WOR-3 bacterium]